MAVVVRPELRPIFTGLVSTVYSIANVAGPVIGGAFAQHTTWRWCFYVMLPFGGTSALIIFLFFQSPKSVRPKQLVPFKEKLSQLDPAGTLSCARSPYLFRSSSSAGRYHQTLELS